VSSFEGYLTLSFSKISFYNIVFKDFDILDLDAMEFVFDNGSIIQSEQEYLFYSISYK